MEPTQTDKVSFSRKQLYGGIILLILLIGLLSVLVTVFALQNTKLPNNGQQSTQTTDNTSSEDTPGGTATEEVDDKDTDNAEPTVVEVDTFTPKFANYPADWKVYMDPVNGFAIAYPGRFMAMPFQFVGTTYAYVYKAFDSAPCSLMAMSVAQKVEGGIGSSATKVDEQTVTIDGHAVVLTTWRAPNGDLSKTLFTSLKDDRELTITYDSCTTDENKSASSMVDAQGNSTIDNDKMINSIRFF